jgi:hypothetical protein
MTTDELARAAAMGAAVPLWALAIQRVKGHLRSQRDNHGCGLAQRVGYRLGKLWAFGQQVGKRVSHRS